MTIENLITINCLVNKIILNNLHLYLLYTFYKNSGLLLSKHRLWYIIINSIDYRKKREYIIFDKINLQMFSS